MGHCLLMYGSLYQRVLNYNSLVNQSGRGVFAMGLSALEGSVRKGLECGGRSESKLWIEFCGVFVWERMDLGSNWNCSSNGLTGDCDWIGWVVLEMRYAS